MMEFANVEQGFPFGMYQPGEKKNNVSPRPFNHGPHGCLLLAAFQRMVLRSHEYAINRNMLNCPG